MKAANTGGRAVVIRELLARKQAVEIVSIRPDGTLVEASSLLGEHNIGVLLVTDRQGRLAGLVSERDVARAVAVFGGEVADRPVSAIMTRKVITCTPDDRILDAMTLMKDKCIRHLPVMENGLPSAIVSLREFDHAYKRLQAESRTDDLTGLANRRAFIEEIAKELSRQDRYGTPFAVALLDIDRFKFVNDTFGHDAGDKVLCALARVLVRELRTCDGVGRLGGEEFAIVFPNTDVHSAAHACKRILGKIRAEEVWTDRGRIRFTASFGVVAVDGTLSTAADILKAADELLYEAKDRGRNSIVAQAAEPDETFDVQPPETACERAEQANTI